MATYNEFWLGEGRSKYDVKGFDETENLDVHSVTGVAKCQLALTSESTTPNEPTINVSVPSGDVYFFSKSSGKIWKRTTGGVYSLANTNSNGAHLGAKFSNGYLYYATSTRLGRTLDFASWSDSWQTFSQTADYRPMEEVNLTLFVGNGNYIASVSSVGAFNDNALDIPSQYKVTCLAESNVSYLLIGTIVNTGMSHAKAFLWDTYSSSWTAEDSVDEIGINTFIKGDGIVFAQCGTEGNVYYWTGSTMEKYKQIRGVTTSVNPYNSTNLKGKPLLAIGNRIYSIFRKDKDLIYAIVWEYTSTTGTIASLGESQGNLFVSTGSNIDKIGTNYATAKISIPISFTSLEEMEVDYESMPSGCSLGLQSSVNGASYVSESNFVDDSTNMKYLLMNGLTFNGTFKFGQAKITLTPNGASTPIIQGITALLETE